MHLKRGARERDRARSSKHDHYMGLRELRNMKVALSHTRATRYLSNGDLVSNNWDCIKKIVIRFFFIFVSATKQFLIKGAYFTEREGLLLLVSLSASYRIFTKK